MGSSQRKKVSASIEVTTDRRSADRHKLVLRVGLIEQDGRSIFCLVKNISSAGVQVKPYGRVSQGISSSLRVGDEDPIAGTLVWSRDGLAGIAFENPLNPETLLRIGQKMVPHKRRTAPRVTRYLRGCLKTAGVRHPATICDISMMGARVRTVQPVTFGEVTTIEVPGLPALRAMVRWADGAEYGLSFHTPLPLQIIADLLSKDHRCV